MKIRCLIIEGVDRGILIDLPRYVPEIRLAIPPKYNTGIRKFAADYMPGQDSYRTYQCCFKSVDGEMALYSSSGSSLDILSARTWIVGDKTHQPELVILLHAELAIVEQSIQ